ncbi:42162_t:CDS:1, partial [Gigaspora margarita]
DVMKHNSTYKNLKEELWKRYKQENKEAIKLYKIKYHVKEIVKGQKQVVEMQTIQLELKINIAI